MSLIAAEREVVITFDDEGDYCTIYAASRPAITKCKKAGYKIIEEKEFEGTAVVTFKCPKNLISFRSQPKKRIISDEKRKEMADRMKRTREAKSL